MIKKELLYFMLVIIAVSVLAIIFYNRDATIASDPCEFHKKLFAGEIDSGVITKKYIDRDNHAIKTVIINSNHNDYELQFIPYNNWSDFDKIKINDVISKPPNSFVFSVNNEFKFELALECQ